MRRRSELIKENWGRLLHSFRKEIMGSMARLGFRNSAGHFPGCSCFHASALLCSALLRTRTELDVQAVGQRTPCWLAPGPVHQWGALGGDFTVKQETEKQGVPPTSPWHQFLTQWLCLLRFSNSHFPWLLCSLRSRFPRGNRPPWMQPVLKGALSS